MADQPEEGTVKVGDEGGAVKEPPAKKLRSSDPDLKVTIKYTTTSSGDDPATTTAAVAAAAGAGAAAETETQTKSKSYDMYAQVFARQSKFVDAMLSVEMKEKQTREIVLHDVCPEVFEMALKYLDDPSAVLSMTAEDALKIVEFYDKYEFASGLQLCDGVFYKHIKKEGDRRDDKPDNLDFLVDVIAAAEKYQLESAKSAAETYMFSKFVVVRDEHYGPEMFTVDHIRKLQQFFLNHRDGLIFPLGLHDVTPEEMSSPLFPKYFCETAAHRFTSRRILKAVVVVGSSSSANGKFVRKSGSDRFEGEVRPHSWDGRLGQCYIARLSSQGGGDWCIVCRYLPGQNQKILWKSPHSQNLRLPPIEPWIPVAPEMRNSNSQVPTIKYIKYENKE